MAFSKKDSFEERQSRIADFADALSHPARLAILETLAQSTVSQHLKELRDIGLIKGEIDGPRSCYRIDAARWDRMAREFGKFIEAINKKMPGSTCCTDERK